MRKMIDHLLYEFMLCFGLIVFMILYIREKYKESEA